MPSRSIQAFHALTYHHHPLRRSGQHRHCYVFAARAVLGIDLGTSNSAVAIIQEGKARIVSIGEEEITPSWVALTEVGCPELHSTASFTRASNSSIQAVALAGRRHHGQEGTTPGTPEPLKHFLLGEAPDWEALQRHPWRATACVL